MPPDRADRADRSGTASGTGQSDREQSGSQPARRAKRARYVYKACLHCQTRKVRCEGGTPCSQCLARGSDCVASNSQPTNSRRERANTTDARSSARAGDSSNCNAAVPGSSQATAVKRRISTNDLLNRLTGIEQQMKAVMAGTVRTFASYDEGCEVSAHSAHSTGNAIDNHESPDSVPARSESDRQTFVGEVSMQALPQANASLGDLAAQYPEGSPMTSGRPLTPKVRTFERHGSSSESQLHSRSWLRELLFSYGIIPEHIECKELLQVFFDHVHVLYPFLHLPSVWETYDYLRKHSFLISPDDLESHGKSKSSIALIFMCLAHGRCTTSSRINNAHGAQSAGWSLYSVAADLIKPLLDVTSDSAISLDGLQVLVVVYLFRLDASEKAQRTLAHAISGAHILGLHQKAFYEDMSTFDDEMFTRIWWTIYILDRRLALEYGRPVLIQDANIETRNPLNVSDEWLTQRKGTTANLTELAPEIEAETSLGRHTVVPYLVAIIAQSRIATDVWKAVYNTKRATGGTPDMLHDYLDISLDHWWQTLPAYLQYNETVPFQDQFLSMAWWQIEQCLTLHMRYVFLKILVRRPGAASTRTATTTCTPLASSQIANEAYCAQRAASIIQLFDKIPKTFPKYRFVFMHPTTSATMILYSIAFRNPSLRAIHGNTLLTAVRILLSYCGKTWVSGKMIRTITRLDRIVQATLNQSATRSVEETRESREGEAQGQELGNSDWATAPGYPAFSNQHISGPSLNAYKGGSKDLPDSLPARANAMILSPPMTEIGKVQGQSALEPSRRVTGQQEQADVSLLWPPTSPDLGFTAQPSWAYADYDFEQAFNGSGNGYGNGKTNDFAYTDTFNFDGGWPQSDCL